MIVDAFIGKTRTVMVAYGFAETALYINSFLNPLVYCLRMREVRRAVKNSLPARCWATWKEGKEDEAKEKGVNQTSNS